MKTLLILRNAKSRPKDPDTSDHDRDLAEVGKRRCIEDGKIASMHRSFAGFIITSTALRSKTTAQIVAKGCKYEGREIAIQPSPYNANLQDYVNIVKEL